MTYFILSNPISIIFHMMNSGHFKCNQSRHLDHYPSMKLLQLHSIKPRIGLIYVNDMVLFIASYGLHSPWTLALLVALRCLNGPLCFRFVVIFLGFKESVGFGYHGFDFGDKFPPKLMFGMDSGFNFRIRPVDIPSCFKINCFPTL